MTDRLWLNVAVLCLGVGMAPRASNCLAQSCAAWNQPAPPTLTYGAAAFDSDRGVVVFRSPAGSANPTTTWECDGATWSVASESGPSPCSNFAMAYDSARQRVVLFGGYSGYTASPTRLNETWEWDGDAWVQRATNGPSPRYDTAMAYDPNLRRVVLFGGNVRDASNPGTITSTGDTWTWDGIAWTLVNPDSPPWREGHSMAFDPLLGSVVMYGGAVDNHLMRFTGTQWVVAATGPGTIAYAPLVFDTQRARLILCKGDAYHWEWDGQTWSQITAPGPINRTSPLLVFDSWRQRTLLLGGRYDNGASLDPNGDFWSWDGANWTTFVPPSPSPRFGTAMIYDSLRDRFVLFGGNGSPDGSGNLSDTWEFHEGQWTRVSTGGPPSRGFHGLAFDSDRGRTILYGGMRAQAPGSFVSLSDTWEWDGATWTQIQGPGPPARYRTSMAYDPVRHATVLFGGSAATDDTWLYDASGWRQVSPSTRPSGRYGEVMAFHPPSGRVLLFGGSSTPDVFLADFWSWDGLTWTQVPSTPGPPGRRSAGMAFDTARNVLVLACGVGVNSTAAGDVWEWNGQVWSQTISTPGPRYLFALAFDSIRGEGRLFGGATGIGSVSEILGDQWRYSASTAPTPVRNPYDIRACPDFPVSFSAQFSGTTPISLQWAHDGVPIDSARSHVLTIPHPSAADAGIYACTASNACGSATSAPATLTFSAVCCGSADFDGDGNLGTDADIEAFFACLAGNCCPTCGSADFNDDGDSATDADIEAFFRVLAGGSC